MLKNGYFTDFTDDGNDVWSFKRKNNVIIKSPKNGDLFKVGDVLKVEIYTNNVMYATLNIGNYKELKNSIENENIVTFSDYIFTSDNIGNLDIEVKVGDSIYLDTASSTVQVLVEGSGYVLISPWLTGFQGEPTRAGGTSIDLKANALAQLGQKNKAETGIYGIDWYSYEPSLNSNVAKQYSTAGKKLEANKDANGGYVNEDGRYWVAVGPEIATPGYNNQYPGQQGTLSSGQFKYGTEVDVVLKLQTGEIVYIQTIIGDVKGHTYPDGVFQTGDPYPNSSNAGEDGSSHRNGSYIEFIGSPQNQSGSMSKYEVIDIIVYGRSW